MKTIRKMILGLLIGGAFGAKVGTYLDSILEVSSSLIFTGLMVGGVIGITIGAAIAMINDQSQLGGFSRKPMFKTKG